MGWVKIDDEFTEHPKVEDLTDGAFRLQVGGLCYCARKLTDGLVPVHRLPRLVPRYRAAQLDELVAAGVWHLPGHDCPSCVQPATAHVVIHDYLEWNRSAEDERDRRRKRAEAGRLGGRRSGLVRRSKTEASAEPNAQASAEPNGKQNRTPSPSPSPSPYASSPLVSEEPLEVSSSSGDDDTVQGAIRILAERDLEHRDREMAERGESPVPAAGGRRDRWVEKAVEQRRELHERVAKAYVATDPSLTPPQLANMLDPRLVPFPERL